MSFIIIATIDNASLANAELELQGHGPLNFSVLLRPQGQQVDATHAALHNATFDPVFEAHCRALSNVLLIAETNAEATFFDYVSLQGLEVITDNTMLN